MNMMDGIVIAVVFILLVGLFYITRKKDRDGKGCSGCHNSCSSCSSYQQIFDEYKKDHPKDNTKE